MSRLSTVAERWRRPGIAGTVVLAALVAGPALPQSRGERIDLLEQRMAVVERQLENQALVEMARQLAALEAEQRRLRGELEELRHALAAAQGRQRDQYVDLDQRLRTLEERLAAASAAAEAGGAEAAYQQALALMKEGRYDEAAVALNQFLASHAGHERAPNAQYWLGEVHYLRREYPAARAAFERVLSEYPEASVAGEARQRLVRMTAEKH